MAANRKWGLKRKKSEESRNVENTFRKSKNLSRRNAGKPKFGYEEQVQRGETSRDEDKADDFIVYGKNSVLEALKSDVEVNKLVVIKDSRDHTIQKIIDLCKEKKLPMRFVEKEAIDRLESGLHQGVLLYTAPYRYAELDEVLEAAESKAEDPFLVLLDGITDPHNLGAILRTAEAAGAHGVIISKRGSAVVTSTVVKISSGAAEHIPVIRVGNLSNTVKILKERGIWVVGTSPEAEINYTSFDMCGPLCIVIGSEGKGISRLVSEGCDVGLRIDLYGKTSSLNASVAAGVLLFEALRQKNLKN